MRTIPFVRKQVGSQMVTNVVFYIITGNIIVPISKNISRYVYVLVWYTYKHLGTGYCSEYAYLLEGKYPDRLEDNHVSYDDDPIQECLNRCLADSVSEKNVNDIGNEAFYLDSDDKCACSKGGCSTQSGSGYDAYKIIQGNRCNSIP